jgi:hypothetical protein
MSRADAARRGSELVSSAKLSLFVAFNAMVVHEALRAMGVRGISALSSRSRGGETTKEWLVREWNYIADNVD